MKIKRDEFSVWYEDYIQFKHKMSYSEWECEEDIFDIAELKAEMYKHWLRIQKLKRITNEKKR